MRAVTSQQADWLAAGISLLLMLLILLAAAIFCVWIAPVWPEKRLPPQLPIERDNSPILIEHIS